MASGCSPHRSRDVHYEEDAHPAYERLLDSLAPDEARILRMMLLSGPQPAVDVRTGGPLGLISAFLSYFVVRAAVQAYQSTRRERLEARRLSRVGEARSA